MLLLPLLTMLLLLLWPLLFSSLCIKLSGAYESRCPPPSPAQYRRQWPIFSTSQALMPLLSLLLRSLLSLSLRLLLLSSSSSALLPPGEEEVSHRY